MSVLTRRHFLHTLSLGLTGIALTRWSGAAPAQSPAEPAPGKVRQPNIVFILADDIGYGDLGCYGATRVKTPQVDRLAREGVRFTDAHSSGAVCTPTRYSLMTGQYAFRNPAGASILSGEAPLSIDPEKTSLASMLKDAGYTTGLVGKWHLGLGRGDLDYNREIKPGPLELGFDYAFFIPATGDRTPCVFVENHRVAGLDPNDPIRVSYKQKVGDEPTGAEHPELLTMKASQGHNNTIINGIGRIGYMSGGKAARWNDSEISTTLAEKSVRFIEQNQDKPFFLYLATHNIHVPRVPNEKYAGKSGCGTRGDVIEEFDGTVGTVLQTLDRLKLAEDTLVIVTSDNGGILDDGYRDGAVENANGHLCNGSWRGFKGSLWEGGHREPFLARWPGRIKPGTTSSTLISTVDMLATFAALTGQSLKPDAAPDSFNVLPALLEEHPAKPPRDYLVLQSLGVNSLAVRKGDWVLIPGQRSASQDAAAQRNGKGADAFVAGKQQPGRKTQDNAYSTGSGTQLYNLKSDPSEKDNLADRHPEVVKELTDLLNQVKTATRSRP